MHRTRTTRGAAHAHAPAMHTRRTPLHTARALPKASSSLSFADEEEEEAAEEESSAPKKPKLGKNPNVDTSMLPDADRQAELGQE